MIEKIESAKHFVRRLLTGAGLFIVAGKEHIFDLLRLQMYPQLSTTAQSNRESHIATTQLTWLGTIIAVLAIVAFFVAVESAIEWSIENRYFVRRLIMREEDIEGEWLSVVRVEGIIMGGGFSEIRYEKGSYIEFGEHYDLSGVKTLHWETTISSYKDRKLANSYIATNHANESRIDGNSCYNFHTLSDTKPFKFCEYDGYVANTLATIKSSNPLLPGVYGVYGLRADAFPAFCPKESNEAGQNPANSSANRLDRKRCLVLEFIRRQKPHQDISSNASEQLGNHKNSQAYDSAH